jgi:glutamate racemase
MPNNPGPIGVFDSGIGGLTIFKEIVNKLPDYNYLYLGDNARVPYGTRSFEAVYQYTKECILHMFDKGCRLVIVACNTASAKALRTIQQNDLVKIPALHRVLGVIRPTTEIIGKFTRSNHVGILATQGTVTSESYVIEISKFFPEIKVFQQGCPLWVPLVENNEHLGPGADYFVKKYLDYLLKQSASIDAIILACTHYPLLIPKIREYVPPSIQLLSQGEIVASSLAEYLSRHPEVEKLCTKGGRYEYFTTESTEDFNSKAALFLGKSVDSKHLQL